MTDVDAALEEQVLDVPPRQRESDVHHHHEADRFGRGVEIAEWTGGFARAWHGLTLSGRSLHR